MAEALQTYIVTPLAGERVAGIIHGGAGTALDLTDAQARYELLLGTIVPEGTVVSVDPPMGPVSAIDRHGGTRGSKAWDVSVGELQVYLLAAILSEVGGTIAALKSRLRGDADLSSDTMGKLATRINTIAAAFNEDIEALEGAFVDRVHDLLGVSDRAAARRNLGLGEIAIISTADVVSAVRAAIEGKEF